MTDLVIKARGLHRSFKLGPNVVPALAGVDIEVRAGEVIAVMGPSGSGKSTLLHVLGLMDVPDSGSYELGGVATGTDARVRAEMRAKSIGFVFQAFHLVEHRRVIDNVGMPLMYQGWSRRRRQTAAAEVLDWVGMSHRLDAFPKTLSGGERQRVAIARSMVHRPRILLCDEPTGSLDTANGQRIVDLLRRAAELEGIAVVIVTHDPSVGGAADRSVLIQDGKILASVT